ncbi:hypothetical protein EDD17DRAFT_1608162, partial [Pisolithus thermaeus]
LFGNDGFMSPLKGHLRIMWATTWRQRIPDGPSMKFMPLLFLRHSSKYNASPQGNTAFWQLKCGIAKTVVVICAIRHDSDAYDGIGERTGFILIAQSRTMPLSGVTVVNNTTAMIHVRITGEGEPNAGVAFYPIDAQKADTWARQHMQVGYVYREDNKKTEVHVVIPGYTWIIS